MRRTRSASLRADRGREADRAQPRQGLDHGRLVGAALDDDRAVAGQADGHHVVQLELARQLHAHVHELELGVDHADRVLALAEEQQLAVHELGLAHVPGRGEHVRVHLRHREEEARDDTDCTIGQRRPDGAGHRRLQVLDLSAVDGHAQVLDGAGDRIEAVDVGGVFVLAGDGDRELEAVVLELHRGHAEDVLVLVDRDERPVDHAVEADDAVVDQLLRQQLERVDHGVDVGELLVQVGRERVDLRHVELILAGREADGDDAAGDLLGAERECAGQRQLGQVDEVDARIVELSQQRHRGLLHAVLVGADLQGGAGGEDVGEVGLGHAVTELKTVRNHCGFLRYPFPISRVSNRGL